MQIGRRRLLHHCYYLINVVGASWRLFDNCLIYPSLLFISGEVVLDSEGERCRHVLHTLTLTLMFCAHMQLVHVPTSTAVVIYIWTALDRPLAFRSVAPN